MTSLLFLITNVLKLLFSLFQLLYISLCTLSIYGCCVEWYRTRKKTKGYTVEGWRPRGIILWIHLGQFECSVFFTIIFHTTIIKSQLWVCFHTSNIILFLETTCCRLLNGVLSFVSHNQSNAWPRDITSGSMGARSDSFDSNVLGLCQQSGKVKFLFCSRIHSTRYDIAVICGLVKWLSSSLNRREKHLIKHYTLVLI